MIGRTRIPLRKTETERKNSSVGRENRTGTTVWGTFQVSGDAKSTGDQLGYGTR